MPEIIVSKEAEGIEHKNLQEDTVVGSIASKLGPLTADQKYIAKLQAVKKYVVGNSDKSIVYRDVAMAVKKGTGYSINNKAIKEIVIRLKVQGIPIITREEYLKTEKKDRQTMEKEIENKNNHRKTVREEMLEIIREGCKSEWSTSMIKSSVYSQLGSSIRPYAFQAALAKLKKDEGLVPVANGKSSKELDNKKYIIARMVRDMLYNNISLNDIGESTRQSPSELLETVKWLREKGEIDNVIYESVFPPGSDSTK